MFFLTIVMYPVLLVLYFVMKTEGKRKENRWFAVTMPRDICDTEITDIASEYEKRLKRNFIVLLLVPIPFFFFPYFSIALTFWMIWVCLILIFTVTPFVWANKKIMQIKQEKHLGEGTEDEDRYWKWGLIYYNPNDKNGIVTNRVGIGMTVNMAKPWGKALYIFSLVVILILPVMGGWLIAEEFTPIYLEIEDGVITAGQLWENYRIMLSDIEEVKLVEELPIMSKKSGSSLENLQKGTFHVRNVGDFETLYNPRNQYVIYIRTADQEYYLGDASDEGTKNVYNGIIKMQ